MLTLPLGKVLVIVNVKVSIVDLMAVFATGLSFASVVVVIAPATSAAIAIVIMRFVLCNFRYSPSERVEVPTPSIMPLESFLLS